MIWPKDSLVPGLSQHQEVVWPNHPNTKESFGQITPQNLKGHFPKIKKNTKESFVHITVEISILLKMKDVVLKLVTKKLNLVFKTSLSRIFFARTWMDSAQKKPEYATYVKEVLIAQSTLSCTGNDFCKAV